MTLASPADESAGLLNHGLVLAIRLPGPATIPKCSRFDLVRLSIE
jgi:hypothetical protein